jgi:beta-glucuronidase
MLRRALTVGLAAAGVLLVAAVLGIAYLAGGPDFAATPTSCGARGESFEVRCVDDVPYLLVDGLPFPTDFDAVDHPVQPLGGTWKLRLDPEDVGVAQEWFRDDLARDAWRDVQVPSTFNTAQSDLRDYDGPVWYALRFRASPRPSDEHFARLAFQGVLLRSSVWLNGERAGAREGGYTPFYLDVTEWLRSDAENTLVVRVDNRPTWTSLPPRLSNHHRPGWAAYGGITRDVLLEWLPAQYVFKARAHTRFLEDGRAELALQVLSRLRGEGPPFRLSVRVNDPAGEVVGDTWVSDPGSTGTDDVILHDFRFEVRRPRPYRPDDPALYRVAISIEDRDSKHSVSFLTGLREVRVRDGGLYLDGEPLFLRGIAMHEDDPVHGATRPQAIVDRDLRLVRELDANYLRLSHYPHDLRTLRTARSLGILLSEEIPFYQVGTGLLQAPRDLPFDRFGLRQLTDPTLLSNAQRQLIEMIERDANNPALVLWGVANESYSFGEEAGRVHEWLAEVARAFDSTRPVTMAELTTSIPALDSRRTASAHMDVVSVNLYYGWYYGETSDAGPALDALHARFPDKPVLVSEFGAGAALGRTDADGVWRAERVFANRTYSESYQARLVGEILAQARARDFVAGVSPWVFADFLCPWFPSNPVPGFNVKGLLSRMREPKEAFRVVQRRYGEIRRAKP